MTTRNDIGRGASRHRLLGALAAAGLALTIAGCGGDDDGDATPATQAADADADAATQATGAPGADEPRATDEPVATEPVATEVQSTTWDPGDVQMRVVNLLADPVDVYVRTTGLIEAWEAFLGVEPGVVTVYSW